MKKLIFLFLLLVSCEKEPEGIFTGVWGINIKVIDGKSLVIDQDDNIAIAELRLESNVVLMTGIVQGDSIFLRGEYDWFGMNVKVELRGGQKSLNDAPYSNQMNGIYKSTDKNGTKIFTFVAYKER